MAKCFKLEVIYEDNHLISVVKPPGMLSQKDRTGDRDIVFFVKDYLKRKYKKKGNVFLGHIHRLDRVAGGVMLFARTSKAASRLSESMRENKIKKEYLLVVNGIMKKEKARLIHFLKRDRDKNLVVAYDKKISESLKEAVLDYEVLKTKKNLSFVKVLLHTGRHHQIRSQFKKIGHPIAGDVRYGKKDGLKYPALWSYAIEFVHPTKKEMVRIEKKPPKIFPWALFL